MQQTKKSNELMAHTYSHLYGSFYWFALLYSLRPLGRPDMSPFLFADAMLHGRPIKVFNNGDMLRDFTYIDDIIEGILRVIDHIPTSNQDWSAQNPDPSSSTAPYKIYNIGNSHPVKLMDFIQAIEGAIGYLQRKYIFRCNREMFIRQMQILWLCRMNWDLSLTNLLKREFRKR